MDLNGIFGGIVEDNKDPEKLGRLKVRVPHVYGAVGGVFGAVTTNDLPWALPAGLPNGLTQQSGGADWIPEIGDQVLVQFLDAEPEKPVWQWFMQTQKAVTAFPLHNYDSKNGSVGRPKRGAWVRYGHTVEWNEDGLILTTSRGYRILLTDSGTEGSDGDILLATQAGQYLDVDDSTGDTTLNVNNDWNVNVGSQAIVMADSFSLTTLNDEIELISGSELTVKTETDFSEDIGGDRLISVAGKTEFDLTGDWTVEAKNRINIKAATDLILKCTNNITVQAENQLNLTSTGVMTLKTPVNMAMEFLELALGHGASSPFVLGDQLFEYLTNLYTVLVSHTHPGVFPGPSSTAPMTPTPPPPPSALLSQVIKGK